MALWRPDATFYPSARTEAPSEKLPVTLRKLSLV
jgi:hypothetical protein